jgi:hypothetical protein
MEKRIKRGVFRSLDKILIRGDLAASYSIIKRQKESEPYKDKEVLSQKSMKRC